MKGSGASTNHVSEGTVGHDFGRLAARRRPGVRRAGQIGSAIVIFPVIIWIWATKDFAVALPLTIYLLVVGLADNIVKPMLMGRGLNTPMLVIFIGVLGGMIAHGILDLFVGPIILNASSTNLLSSPARSARSFIFWPSASHLSTCGVTSPVHADRQRGRQLRCA